MPPRKTLLLDAWVLRLAKEIPDRGTRGNDVRLVTAVRDHVVDPVLETQMLAPVIPAGVHQLDGIKRAPASPRRARAVSGLAVEGVFDRHESVGRG